MVIEKFTFSRILLLNGGGKILPFILIIFLSYVGPIFGQGDGTGLNSMIEIRNIEIEFSGDSIAVKDKGILISTILSKFKIYSGENIRVSDIDVAIQRLNSVPEVKAANYRLELGNGVSYTLILELELTNSGLLKSAVSGLLTKNKTKNFPFLYNSKSLKLKIDLGATVSPVVGLNTWLNNGELFTQFSPFGKDYPKNNRFFAFESAFTVGGTLVLRISDNSFLYGNYRLLFASTLGRDLNRSDNPSSLLTENLYGGIVGSFPTKNGSVFTYNLSVGKQPYRIGTGMLLCQIALNGGERGATNIWPRFSGDFVGLAQFRYNNLKAEYFYVDPNEFGGLETQTKLTGGNIEYSKFLGIKTGFTYLNVLQSTSIYLLPDFTQETRKGLNAYNLRFEKEIPSGRRSVITKLDAGMQTNNRFPMQAFGIAAELGFIEGGHKLRPSLSYRFSHLTGDNPKTERFERWDFLYSGNDVDTWIQGLIMKNMLFNTNLQAHRLQGQMLWSKWRLTTQYFYFRSAQLNNLPLAINEFASKELAHQVTIMAEKSFLKRFYTRLQIHSLWAIDGLTQALPNPSSNPWVGAQAMLRYQL